MSDDRPKEGAYPVPPDPNIELVEVSRFSEQPPAEIARELLESSGITAFVSGSQARSAMPFTGAIELRLMVPADRVAEARELLQAMQIVPGAEGEDGDEEDEPVSPEDAAERAGGDADERPPQRLRRVAVVCAFVLPGGANFYARHGLIGFALLTVLVACVLSFGAVGIALAYPLVIAADLVSGLGSVRRCNEGRIASPGQQLAIGGAIWALIAVLALFANAVAGIVGGR